MSRFLLPTLLGCFLLTISIHAQTDLSRFQKQHHTDFNKKNLNGIQKMLLKTIEEGNPDMVSGALQTFRELEIVFPAESFEMMLDPLIKIVKDENYEIVPRILALFALENFHSDKGDTAIREAQNSTKNRTIQEICIALLTGDLPVDRQ